MKRLFILALLVCFSSSALAGVTFTEIVYSNVKLIKAAWVSDATGDASGTTTNTYDGQVLEVATVPNTSATPTDNYDVVVTEENSVDVCKGNAANRDKVTTEYISQANCGAVADSKLTVTISNAGDTKQGTIYIWVR